MTTLSHAQKERERSRIYRKKYPKVIRNRRLKYNYNITLTEYTILLNNQRGVCAICGRKERIRDNRTGKIRTLAVDHDHATNKVRGLLCYACNRGLGVFEDDLDRIKSAVNYLQQGGVYGN